MSRPTRCWSAGLLFLVLALAAAAGSAPTPPPEGEAPRGPEAGPVVADTLRAGAKSVHSLTLERTPSVGFILAFPAGELDLTMISPSGKRYGPDLQPSEHGGYAGDDESVLGLLPGRMRAVFLEDPEPGDWTVEVSAVEVPDSMQVVPYMLMTMFQATGVALTAALPGGIGPVRGERFPIRGVLRSGADPVRGAQVEALVRSPDSTQSEVPLHDDGVSPDSAAGDGVYSGWSRATTRSGAYWVNVRATGTSGPDSAQFTRTEGGLVIVRAGTGRFVGPLHDRGLDANGNGFIEAVGIECGVRVDRPGKYSVVCDLLDAKGNPLGGSKTVQLAPGLHRVTVPIPASWFRQIRAKGSLTLKSIRLFEGTDSPTPMLDERQGGFRTGPYDADLMEVEPMAVLGLAGVSEVDDDHDGRYEILRVKVDVFVSKSGKYEWSCSLADWDENELVRVPVMRDIQLAAGKATLTFDFPGECIRRSGIDGEYLLNGLDLYGPAGWLPSSTIRLGKLFDHSQFGGPLPPGDDSATPSPYRCNP